MASILGDKAKMAQLQKVDWGGTMHKLFSLDGAGNIIIFICMLALGHMVGTYVRDYIRKVAAQYENKKQEAHDETPSDERKSVYLASVVTSSLVYYVIMLSMLVFAFHMVGVAITGIIAWVGVFGVIIGFALQGFLQDLVSGIVMACTGKFRVNDMITMGEGNNSRLFIIESFNLLNTTLRDIATNAIAKLSNRKIQEAFITNMTVGKVYYVLYPILVHNSTGDYSALVDKLTRAIDVSPVVMESRKKSTIGFSEVSNFGTKLSLRVPIMASQYTVEKENKLGIFVRDILRKHNVIVLSGSNPIS